MKAKRQAKKLAQAANPEAAAAAPLSEVPVKESSEKSAAGSGKIITDHEKLHPFENKDISITPSSFRSSTALP